MEHNDCDVIILADEPAALTELCGISILERLLRILQRLGTARVTIVSAAQDLIRTHLANPSWARAEVSLNFAGAWPPLRKRTLVISAAYYDARMLAALLAQQTPTLLVDHRRHCAAALINPADALAAANADSFFDRLAIAAKRGEIQTLNLAAIPSYITSMRRSVPLVWFPAPTTSEASASAERQILGAAQNGTLDLPAIVHAPIETWMIRRLCRTAVTPNQITLFTATVSAVVTLLFALGSIVTGTVLALVVGVLDGLDGKQARVKIETTPLGQREHALDYLLELSWWTALAYHFGSYPWLLLLIGSDLLDRLAKKHAKQLTGRNLDDVAPFDRFVRLIGGRRNIYIWIFAAGLLARAADKAFVALCCWGAVTAAVHLVRVGWLYAGRAERVSH